MTKTPWVNLACALLLTLGSTWLVGCGGQSRKVIRRGASGAGGMSNGSGGTFTDTGGSGFAASGNYVGFSGSGGGSASDGGPSDAGSSTTMLVIPGVDGGMGVAVNLVCTPGSLIV